MVTHLFTLFNSSPLSLSLFPPPLVPRKMQQKPTKEQVPRKNLGNDGEPPPPLLLFLLLHLPPLPRLPPPSLPTLTTDTVTSHNNPLVSIFHQNLPPPQLTPPPLTLECTPPVARPLTPSPPSPQPHLPPPPPPLNSLFGGRQGDAP